MITAIRPPADKVPAHQGVNMAAIGRMVTVMMLPIV
jgi:hypothetical protein